MLQIFILKVIIKSINNKHIFKFNKMIEEEDVINTS